MALSLVLEKVHLGSDPTDYPWVSKEVFKGVDVIIVDFDVTLGIQNKAPTLFFQLGWCSKE